jgi:hypothetical protein
MSKKSTSALRSKRATISYREIDGDAAAAKARQKLAINAERRAYAAELDVGRLTQLAKNDQARFGERLGETKVRAIGYRAAATQLAEFLDADAVTAARVKLVRRWLHRIETDFADVDAVVSLAENGNGASTTDLQYLADLKVAHDIAVAALEELTSEGS